MAVAARLDAAAAAVGRRFRVASGCVSCSGDIAAVRRLPGVREVQVLDASGLVLVAYDGTVTDAQVVAAAAASGITLTPEVSAPTVAAPARAAEPAWWRRPQLLALAAAAVLLTAGLVVEWAGGPEPVATVLFTAVLAVGGVYPVRHAAGLLRRGRLGIGTLLVIAAAGAVALGRLEEAAELVVIFSLGEVLEGWAADRARRSIRALMALTPAAATRLRPDGGSDVVAVEQLNPGEVVLVRPGERIPTDGPVIDGASWVDASAVTGESMPVETTPGVDVFGGTVNGAGALHIRVAKPFADTVLARVIHQVQEAQTHRGQAQRFADRFGAVYTPIMLALAAVVAAAGPLLGVLTWREALYRALVLFVVSCSCGLVISVPVTVVAAITRGARDGILIKGGAHLERLAHLDAVAFDKTGTLTTGRPRLTRVQPLAADLDAAELLRTAAAVEAASEHPIATAIVAAATHRGLSLPAVRDAVALPGVGMRARLNGRVLRIGRPAPDDLTQPNIAVAVIAAEQAGHTPVLLRGGDRVLGLLAVADQLRPDAADTIAALRRLGVRRVLMLTGDNPTVAATIAHTLGLDDHRAGLLPEDKTAAIRELKTHYGTTAMIGDGINDAPALATADLAIAMGAAGTDIALETADVALMADDLTRLPAAIALARRARTNIAQNITLSLATVAALITAALAGWIGLATGVVLNEGTAVLIILNGLRILRRPQPAAPRTPAMPVKKGPTDGRAAS